MEALQKEYAGRGSQVPCIPLQSIFPCATGSFVNIGFQSSNILANALLVKIASVSKVVPSLQQNRRPLIVSLVPRGLCGRSGKGLVFMMQSAIVDENVNKKFTSFSSISASNK